MNDRESLHFRHATFPNGQIRDMRSRRIITKSLHTGLVPQRVVHFISTFSSDKRQSISSLHLRTVTVQICMCILIKVCTRDVEIGKLNRGVKKKKKNEKKLILRRKRVAQLCAHIHILIRGDYSFLQFN